MAIRSAPSLRMARCVRTLLALTGRAALAAVVTAALVALPAAARRLGSHVVARAAPPLAALLALVATAGAGVADLHGDRFAQ